MQQVLSHNNSLEENNPEITEDKIKWVVTVPAIWKLSQKGIMMKASEMAGLVNENTNRLNFLLLNLKLHHYIVHKKAALLIKIILNQEKFI